MNTTTPTQAEIDAYDRDRLPKAYAIAMHHARGFRREAQELRHRDLPGDRFRAASALRFARNNEWLADEYRARAAEFGVSVGEDVVQDELFGEAA